jgi:hypothetical protein
MPFVNPMLFGSSEPLFIARVSFGSMSSVPSGSDGPFYGPSSITILEDPDGYFSGVGGDTNKAIWASFGTYQLVVLQNYIDGDNANGKLVDGYEGGFSSFQEQNTATVVSNDVAVNPGKLTWTIDNDFTEDGLTVKMEETNISGSGLNGTLIVGIKKL